MCQEYPDPKDPKIKAFNNSQVIDIALQYVGAVASVCAEARLCCQPPPCPGPRGDPLLRSEGQAGQTGRTKGGARGRFPPDRVTRAGVWRSVSTASSGSSKA